MESYLTPRIALLSALYFIIALVLLFFMDIGVYYFLNNFVFDILNWFNHIHFAFKLLIIIVGGVSIFVFLLDYTQKISSLIGGLIFDRLPHNLFTICSTLIVSMANAVYSIILLWKVPEHYSFWVIIELFFISVFLWSLSAIVMPAREQMKEYRKDNYY